MAINKCSTSDRQNDRQNRDKIEMSALFQQPMVDNNNLQIIVLTPISKKESKGFQLKNSIIFCSF